MKLIVLFQEGTVISVTETLAYATTAGYGTVFLPGFAFDSIEVTRLNAYLKQGDRVLMIIQAQPEYRGVSHFLVKDREDGNLIFRDFAAIRTNGMFGRR